MSNDVLSLLNELVETARSLYQRGYSFGTAGNISIRIGPTVYCTPTGSSLGSLSVDTIAQVDLNGEVSGSLKPTKELPFHLAAYRARPHSTAVVHLHSTYATAVACLRELDTGNALPVLTPYYAMRIPCLPVARYLPPGDAALGPEVETRLALSPGVLLRNHGSIAVGQTLAEASALAEEIEEAARLFLILGDRGQPLSPEQIAELRKRFR